VCVYGLQLYIVDITTGGMTRLLIPEDFAFYPDWSPNGRYIVYGASGIRLLDLSTGESLAIRGDSVQTGGSIYGGQSPLWSPDGTQIAVIQILPHESRIAMFSPDGTGYRILASTGNHLVSYDILHWYVRPTRGMEGLAFRQITGPGAGRYYVDRNGSGLRRFEYPFHEHQAFSPDGEWKVRTGIDPVDSVGVLFVERVDDVTGATRRQLTFWGPPSPSGPALHTAATVSSYAQKLSNVLAR
jgi:WD40 repeat protein